MVWDWPAWRAWFVSKFNPDSKVLRKMGEYRRCAQGRRTVDEYHEEYLELRSFCPSKGDDLEQKVQFLSGLNPELGVLVKQSLASFPKASLDQTVELARNLSELLPKSTAAVRGVLDGNPTFPKDVHPGVECYNCNERGHYANACPQPRRERTPAGRNSSEKGGKDGGGRGGGRHRKTAAIKGDKDKVDTKVDAGAPSAKKNDPNSNGSCSIRSSLGVFRVDSLQSRAAPVFEVPASIDGVSHRLGLDTLAGVSCVGSADLSPQQLSRAVPTAERLHHAGGEPLSTALEVTLDVSLGPFVLPVTFNVVETGRFKLGFLLGMELPLPP